MGKVQIITIVIVASSSEQVTLLCYRVFIQLDIESVQTAGELNWVLYWQYFHKLVTFTDKSVSKCKICLIPCDLVPESRI
jgi:hypothetical protein